MFFEHQPDSKTRIILNMLDDSNVTGAFYVGNEWAAGGYCGSFPHDIN